MSRIVVVGGGIGGLAAAALLGRAGHDVTLIEAADYLGGKSRRITVDGQRMDTGPSLFTFPGVWREFTRRYGDGTRNLDLIRMPEVGRYHYRGESVSLPVEEGHPWHDAWQRFEREHGSLGPDITKLLTADPTDPKTLPALGRLLKTYGAKLTTRSYIDGLDWMPEGLKEVIAIHTLNAGVSPSKTPALYASMPAVMSRDGVYVPDGGVYEVVAALVEMCGKAGVELRTGEKVVNIGEGKVTSEAREYYCDIVVSNVEEGRMESLVSGGKDGARKLSCSGVAIYAAVDEELELPPHSVVLPDNPDRLHQSLEAGRLPEQTMAFVNYYRSGEVYPNEKPTLAVLLTAPADGKTYDTSDTFVVREIERISEKVGLSRPATEYFTGREVLHPRYFSEYGGPGGSLYGRVRPVWRSGPFHSPSYNERKRPWLWRVGASVHPGGGIPAVLGGAMVATSRLLNRLSRKM